MPSALITGATGGLGRALSALLVESGVRVVGLSTSRPRGVDDEAFIEADITSLNWADACKGFDVVFHLAAYVHRPILADGDVRRAVVVNADATRRLAEACARQEIPLVFASSVMAATADDPLRSSPPNVYATSKRDAEKAVEEAGQVGLRHSIVRFPLLYGPFGRGNMERLLRAIYRRRYWPIEASDVRKSCLYFADAADALVCGWKAVSSSNRSFVVAPAVAPTLGTIHREAYAAFDRKVPWPPLPRGIVEVGAGLLDAAANIRGRVSGFRMMIRTLTSPAVSDGSAFAKATGFSPKVSLALGMRQTAEWIKDSVV